MFYKIVENGYITVIGTGDGGKRISEGEYKHLQHVIKNRPIPETGFDYRLKEDLTWELYECPVVDEGEREISDSEALEIILGGEGV